ncbi:MAG: hypothetical protein V3W37_08340 [Candidatus Binatia bacterium]
MTTPLYFTLGGVPMTEEKVAEQLGITPGALRKQAEEMCRDHMMCQDSEGNFHHSPVSEALLQQFEQEMRH